jgi:hypothetical protein
MFSRRDVLVMTARRRRALRPSATQTSRKAQPMVKVRVVGPIPMCRIINYTQGADDMSDHDKWISYSHWGMFPTGTKSSK